jgi:uncharacterized protein (DUF433 family)
MNLLSRIAIDPAVCHSKPCIQGMRWPAEVVLDILGAGMTFDEILEDHPELEQGNIQACLQHASRAIAGKAFPLVV